MPKFTKMSPRDVLIGRGKAAAEARLTEMCRKLLANPVIEDFRFEIEEA